MGDTIERLAGQREAPFGDIETWGEDNIKMYPWEIRCYDVDWIGLADDKEQRRARVSTVMARDLLSTSVMKRRIIKDI